MSSDIVGIHGITVGSFDAKGWHVTTELREDDGWGDGFTTNTPVDVPYGPDFTSILTVNITLVYAFQK